MNIQEMVGKAQDSLTVKKVFGEPFEKDGVTVIPAAKVQGGAGGGSDHQQNGGGGFGLSAQPSGAFVIKDGQVKWEPALDLNRAFLVGIIALLVIRSIIKAALKTLRG